MHAVIAECRHQPGSIICVLGHCWCSIIVTAVSHPPVIVDINMVFRGEDADERLVPAIHFSAESRDHEERFTGTEFPVSQGNPIDPGIFDRC